MKLKYLLESSNALLGRLNEDILPSVNHGEPTSPSGKWRFVSNANCCEACQGYDGYIVESQTMPIWYGHVPGEPGRFNCRCKWVPVTGV